MAFNVREVVSNPSAAEFQQLYDRIDRLVNEAGHLTILDLFTKSSDEIGREAWEAISAAKEVGVFSANNHGCCKGGNCVESERGWCNTTARGKCSALSDVCRP